MMIVCLFCVFDRDLSYNNIRAIGKKMLKGTPLLRNL